MSFWKKGEDPWDIDPDKRKPAQEPEKAAPGLLDSLRGHAGRAAGEAGKAAAVAGEVPVVRPGYGAGLSHGRPGRFLVSRHSHRKSPVASRK